ncbi:MATE family multidrug resistance protein [Litorivivens lipolytica]|uniref:MATE family multidrug resistance protein n=1 Tax=Litorivivens lipolytica TaxID=1524264 RepID=A0A7W4W6Z3_9GAMM|nr:MATE family efflux transporter [Litorivivens lipolytica]MBB3048606.1 MATE family multidrug resistance protein [Litorivivens lipolytica]
MSLHHKIWRIAGPLILSNLSVPLLGLVDTAILGHLDSPTYLAAVAVGSSILAFFYWGFGFLRMGTTGASAQAWGAEDEDQQAQVLLQSTALALGLGLSVMLIGPWLAPLAVSAMQTPDSAREFAASYLDIRLLSAPAVLLTYVAVGWLIGQQRARWALVVMVATNALNIVLDYLLILGAGLNSDGAAWASVISEYSGLGIALWAVGPALRGIARQRLAGMLVSANYRAILQTNSALFIRTAALLFAFAFFTAQSATYGTTVLAANTILLNLLLFTSHGLDGFAHAAEALVGESAGRKHQQEFTAVCRACGQWSLAMGVLLSIGLLLGQDPIINLMTDLPAVATSAHEHFFWLAALPLISVASYLLDGIFIGTLQTRWMQHTMLLCVAAVYLPAWHLGQGLGSHGLWLAFLLFNLARGLSLGLVFARLQHRRDWW